jgi:hypothetical protein
MAKMKAMTTTIPKPVRLRTVLKAIKTRRAKGGRLTQADYAVALDRVVRAVGRSLADGETVHLSSVRMW